MEARESAEEVNQSASRKGKESNSPIDKSTGTTHKWVNKKRKKKQLKIQDRIFTRQNSGSHHYVRSLSSLRRCPEEGP